MNGSTENRAHGAPQKSARRETVLNLATARNMLPLVQRIIDDILQNHKHLAQLLPEQNRLDRHRRDLSWPERSRRYQVQEEIAATSDHLQGALAELEKLGLRLLDAEEGRVGFPTAVNNRRAFFSWRPGDDGISHWHFADETARRPIPATWTKSANISLSIKG